MGASIQLYTLLKLPSSKEAHLQVMAISLEATNAVLPSPLCTDPIPPLAAMLAIFKAMLDSLSVAWKDKV